MRTDPDVEEIVNGDRGMLRGIQACLEQQCLVSAVSLVYSCIDSLAALTRPDSRKNTTGKIFQAWVNLYLIPTVDLGCTAEDLYGARCGVLHTYSTDSSLARDGLAKPLVYYWKHGPSPDVNIPLPPNAVKISIEDLVSALREAVATFLFDIGDSKELAEIVERNRKLMLCYVPDGQIAFQYAA